MPGRKECTLGVPELVVARKREANASDAPLLAALANELPARIVPWVDLRREVANLLVYICQEPAHVTLPKSRLR